MLKKIDKYILRETIVPLLVTLGISALLLLLEKMLSLFDFVINQGGPIDIVWRMLGNLMPQYLTLVLPLSMFLGVLLAVRKLALNSELDALLATGFSLNRLVQPTLYIALFLLVVNVIVVGFVQPYSRYTYQELVFDIRSGALGASIKAGEFNDLGDGLTLRIEESRESGRELIDIFAQKESDDGRIQSISAEKGNFFISPDKRFMILRLHNGTLIDLDMVQGRPNIVLFELHDLPLDVPNFAQFRDRGEEAKEMTITELWNARNSDDPAVIATIHSRTARALSILIVPFLAIPLGLVAKRSGRALGITVGVVILLVYHKVLEFGLNFSSMGDVSSWLVIWLPTLLFMLLTARLYYIGAYKVGGMPLRRIEIIYDVTVSALKSMITRLKAVS
ncbi:LPS export ABC transporter permease LptF [Paremcibacter congregatus]|uniref:LPS export ABC transporter permease LptF n=1 Tax=Paremcibacter congregatus TaxID=2043170 RepID=A0A2G4YNE1_9PROT|nr:LPS export ABC transporter permease LptF [Paremcibacter congregatus]PHZ83830.1 LPS export ABC transporter permease LptF [Paremcibacter congregatus]QDE27534.1 LPS export ABC transporter permease LptF [Paremcibacter congregatus]